LYFPDAAGIARNEIFSKQIYQTKAIQNKFFWNLKNLRHEKTSSKNTTDAELMMIRAGSASLPLVQTRRVICFGSSD
jgi:hypothetical protein